MVKKKDNAMPMPIPADFLKKFSGLNIILMTIIAVLIIVMIILIVSLVGKSCETQDVIVDTEITTEGGEEASGVDLQYCEENIIPDKVVFKILLKEVDVGPRLYDRIVSTWKDGTPIYILPVRDDDKEVRCRIGDPRKGEKNEYFYCKNLHYIKTSVDRQGNPGQTIEYLVDLALDRTEYEIMHNHARSWVGTINLKVANKVVSGTCKER